MTLTAKGQALITDIFAEHETVIEQVTGGLNYEEKEKFVELAKKLGKFAITV